MNHDPSNMHLSVPSRDSGQRAQWRISGRFLQSTFSRMCITNTSPNQSHLEKEYDQSFELHANTNHVYYATPHRFGDCADQRPVHRAAVSVCRSSSLADKHGPHMEQRISPPKSAHPGPFSLSLLPLHRRGTPSSALKARSAQLQAANWP